MQTGGHKVLLGCAQKEETVIGDLEACKGLLPNHAYSILQVSFDIENKTLLQVRNPWGFGEWTGAWSDKWPEWPEEAKDTLKLEDKADGSFWMDASDFTENFNTLYVCNILPKSWMVIRMEGEWIPGESAGGSLNNRETWGTNPAFKLTTSKDTDSTSVHVVLSQPDARMGCYRMGKGASDWGVYPSSIGMVVYKSTNGYPKAKIKKSDIVAMTKTYKATREVSMVMVLEGGFDYYLVPSTFHPDVAGLALTPTLALQSVTVSSP